MRQTTLRFHPYSGDASVSGSSGKGKLTYTTSSGPLASTSGAMTPPKSNKPSETAEKKHVKPIPTRNNSNPPRRSEGSESWADRRSRLKAMADGTLKALERGFYSIKGSSYSLQPHLKESVRATKFYGPDSELSNWHVRRTSTSQHSTDISVLEISTLEAAWSLSSSISTPSTSSSSSYVQGRRRVGILNFASATKPGGGFINGAQAQEESIARASALYPSLMSPIAQTFYSIHKSSKSKHNLRPGYYTHSMIWSPEVSVFRDDDGGWLQGGGYTVDVVTSAAVNAGVVRERSQSMRQSLRDKENFVNEGTGQAELEKRDGREGTPVEDDADEEADEQEIEKVMRERMARVLYLFESQGVDTIVLGSFGTGVFRNRVGMVARIWREMLVKKSTHGHSAQGAVWSGEGRFNKSFRTVLFAVLGRETFEEFRRVFEET